MSDQVSTPDISPTWGGVACLVEDNTRPGGTVSFDTWPAGARREFVVYFRALDEGGVLAYAADAPGALAEGGSAADALSALEGVLKEFVAEYRSAGQGLPVHAVEPEANDVRGATLVLDV